MVVDNPADGGFIYWLVKLYLFGLLVVLALVVAAAPLTYLMVAAEAPPAPDLRTYRARAALATQILTADGQVLTRLVRERRELVEVSEIPPLLIKAFLAAEDRDFYRHAGVDFGGILRAALVNLRAGTVRQGGSTITQQVAKSFLSPERTIQRKLKELVLARRIEARYSKEEILYLYLNHIFLGARAYGVKAAARAYFNKDLAQLLPGEMALLAGLARAPSRYSPRASVARARRRRNRVLKQMLAAGFIPQATYDRERASRIRLSSPGEADPLRWLAPHVAEHARRSLVKRFGRDRVYGAGWQVSTTVDLWLQTLARQRTDAAVRALDKRQGWRGPVMSAAGSKEREQVLDRLDRLYALDKPLQVGRPYLALVERVASSRAHGRIGTRRKIEIPLGLMKWAARYSRTNAENEREIESVKGALRPGDVVWVAAPRWWLRPKGWGAADERVTKMALDQRPRVEGALYSYDHHSGYLLAMVGGLDYDRSTYNRTIQACRQPGSTYKPIFYSLALDSPKYSMATILQDKPYEPEPGEEWNPQNVHGTLDGKVTMHMALVRSLNLPSIQIVNEVGPKNVERWARRLGFTTPIHADRALALGASCTRIDELSRAFATFARGGTQRDPVYIRQIRDRDDRVIEDHTVVEDPFLSEGDRLDRLWATSTERPKRVIDARTAFLITKLLRDAVLYGIAARCRIVPVPTGGKGGTSSDTADVWFVGSTSRWTTAAWIGDDTYQRPLGEKEASYTSAIPMWANYMKVATAGRHHQELPAPRPAGLRTATIDFDTGKPPTPTSKKTVMIYYRPGSYHPNASSSE